MAALVNEQRTASLVRNTLARPRRHRYNPPIYRFSAAFQLDALVRANSELQNEKLARSIMGALSKTSVTDRSRNTVKALNILSDLAQSIPAQQISEDYLNELAEQVFGKQETKKRVVDFFKAVAIEVIEHKDAGILEQLWHQVTTGNNRHQVDVAADILVKIWVKKPDLFTEHERDRLLEFLRGTMADKDRNSNAKASEFYSHRSHVIRRVLLPLVQAGHPLVVNSDFAQKLSDISSSVGPRTPSWSWDYAQITIKDGISQTLEAIRPTFKPAAGDTPAPTAGAGGK